MILRKARDMPRDKFKAGVSKVQYAGACFDLKEIRAVTQSLQAGWLGIGKKAREFEDEFSRLFGVKETIVTNSGSSANLLAIAALELDRGDEIITSACGFPTTFNPIIQNGLVPVVVDVELGNYNISPALVKKAITKKTKAIILAHTLGNPCQMDQIMDIAAKYNLKVIEDNCDSLGAKFKGRFTGSFGDIGTSSFYVAHHITMGEGGALYTNNLPLALKIRSLRDWGRSCVCKTCVVIKNKNAQCNRRLDTAFTDLPVGYDNRYVYTSIGYNLKPTEMQCAFGLQQLKRLAGFIKKRNDHFHILNNFFKDYEKFFILPKYDREAEPSWFAYPLTVKDSAPFSRKEIVSCLEGNNIETRLLFAGNITRHPAYKKVKIKVSGDLRNADKVMQSTFFLGVWPGLKKEELRFVLDTAAKFLGRYV